MKLLASSLCALALAACASDSNEPPFVDVDGDGVNDNDPTALRTFTMRIENVAPFTILKSGVARTKPDKTDGNLAPGEYYEIRFTAGLGHRLTLASMLLESNDWFFGTDPAGIPLYDAAGNPLSGDITNQLELWDAGTEYDEEPGVGPNTGLLQVTRTDGQADPNNHVRLVPGTVTLSNGQQFTRPAIDSMIRLTLTPGTDRQFVLRVENVSTDTTLVTSQGTKATTVTPVLFVIHCDSFPNILFDADQPARDNGLEYLAESAGADTPNDKLRLLRGVTSPISSGVVVVHAGGNPLFIADQPDSNFGLEALAEDGNIAPLVASLDQGIVLEAQSYAKFDTPVDAPAAGPCHAGQAYEVTFQARPGDRLSFASAFSSSNDWFIAPPGEGMPLFNGNLPRWGEITTEFKIWDLGTERDQELDVGNFVGTQQTAPNTGNDDSNKMVREVGRDRYDVPLTRHIRVTLTPPQK
jgi:hypothetical protein